LKTIRELREAKDWTQFQLAIQVGVSPSTIYNWESGRAEPRVSQLRRLAELFGVRMDDVELVPEADAKKIAA